MRIRKHIETKRLESTLNSLSLYKRNKSSSSRMMILTKTKFWEEKQNVRNQTQNGTHNDPEKDVTEIQQFHKPT